MAGREEQVEVEWWSNLGIHDAERGGEDGMALDTSAAQQPGGGHAAADMPTGALGQSHGAHSVAAAHAGAGQPGTGAGAPAGQPVPDVCPALLQRVKRAWPGRSERFWHALCRLLVQESRPWNVVNQVLADHRQHAIAFPSHLELPPSFRPCTAKDSEIIVIVECVLRELFEFQVRLSVHALCAYPSEPWRDPGVWRFCESCLKILAAKAGYVVARLELEMVKVRERPGG